MERLGAEGLGTDPISTLLQLCVNVARFSPSVCPTGKWVLLSCDPDGVMEEIPQKAWKALAHRNTGAGNWVLCKESLSHRRADAVVLQGPRQQKGSDVGLKRTQ